eukprot:882272-Rhodomonas_salina.1
MHTNATSLPPSRDSGRRGTPPLQSVSSLQSTEAVRGNPPPSTVLLRYDVEPSATCCRMRSAASAAEIANPA